MNNRHGEVISDAMPKREKGESLSNFISRFMGSKRERRKFPEEKQRLAVGYAEARERSKKERK